MDLEAKHIDPKRTKVIGKLNGNKVVQMMTTGGLVIIAMANAKSERSEPLAFGSHPGIAKLIARKKNPKLEITELSKSDDCPEQYLLDLVPRWEAITDEARRRAGF